MKSTDTIVPVIEFIKTNSSKAQQGYLTSLRLATAYQERQLFQLLERKQE
jgi:hypothetical protein